MRGLDIEKLNAAVSGILGKHRAKIESRWTRPTLHQVIHQSIVGGGRLAPWAPFFLLLVGALGDYESMRQFLLTATTEEMSRTVMVSLVGGFLVGAVVQVLIDITTPKLPGYRDGMLQSDRLPAAAWYWDLPPDGRDLAIREVTTARCTPNAATRWALDDLLKELTRSETKGGSDLLDRKLMQMLGIQSQQLKPTQKLDDAIRLLSLRYRGMPSSYEWDVKVEEASPGFNAFVVVRPTAKNAAIEVEPWQRCLVAGGPSEALAVTIAAITRETWAFTT
ncbi:hypothetical protein [Pseudomonas sp. UMAB-40]|uniref:hypothetical protein n=1 Tax=Pseudomonas sp. UMAB-40 TaxID=1365407 RepID=UPI001C59A0BE|nr:hypothetical protein [Pseudomonas sp. UMAB-40]